MLVGVSQAKGVEMTVYVLVERPSFNDEEYDVRVFDNELLALKVANERNKGRGSDRCAVYSREVYRIEDELKKENSAE